MKKALDILKAIYALRNRDNDHKYLLVAETQLAVDYETVKSVEIAIAILEKGN